ncbi:ATP-binding cassette, sub-B (MDR TAP), member 8 [Phlyctochytrium planicorne]|nr:ATP-binding cassette, sub-B (MDR TAP), member 8 [Phlyctochytrium planicorne]
MSFTRVGVRASLRFGSPFLHHPPFPTSSISPSSASCIHRISLTTTIKPILPTLTPFRPFSTPISRNPRRNPKPEDDDEDDPTKRQPPSMGLMVLFSLPLVAGIGLWVHKWMNEDKEEKVRAGRGRGRGLHAEGRMDGVVAVEGKSGQGKDEEVKSAEKKERTTWETVRDVGLAVAPDVGLVVAIITVTTATAMINIATPSIIGELVSVVQDLTRTTASSVDPTATAAAATGLAAWIPHASPSFAAVASALSVPAGKLLAMFVAQGFLTFVDITLVTRLGESLSLRLRGKLYDAILRQDMAFFDAHLQGEVVGRLTQDVAEFKHTFKLVITQGLKCVTQIIGTSLHLLRLSSRLTLLLLTTMPFLYVAMNLYGVYLRSLSKKARSEESIASGVAGEAISNIRTVRAFAAEGRELDVYMDAAEKASRVNGALGYHIGLFQGMTNFSIGSMVLIILYYGGSLVASGEMTGGQLMTYMVSTQNAQRSLALVGVLFGQVIKAFGSAARVFEYIDHPAKIPVDSGERPFSGMTGKIEFKDVTFSYPTRPGQTILQDFNLTVPVGKVVALCGPSGSGKSTIGQLIERFYDTDRGAVLIDGFDVRQLDPSWIRRNVGYINQEPILFATSILENIRYGRPDATPEEVREAAHKANASSFIDSFPMGYDTVVGERGVTLSGGQKQRIAIAKNVTYTTTLSLGAILKDPKVLILDEATSALDTQSERIVQDALEKLMKGRTVLVIAHRLSTIQAADLIVVMGSIRQSGGKGNIVEMGTHQELMRKRGAYHRLYNRLSEEEAEKKGGGIFGG